MKRCSLFCAGFWPFILLPLLLLIPVLFFNWHAIEEDVARNTQADLTSIGADWASVETTNRGRDVLITGTAPNEAAITEAREKAEKSYGVNLVDISSDVRPTPTAPVLNTIITGESVILRGTLRNQKSIDDVISQAETAFGSNNVTNKLQLGSNTAALPSLGGFFPSLAGKSYSLETLNASLTGNSLTLKGTVNSAESNTMLNAQMTRELKLDVTNMLTVAAPAPPPEVITEPIATTIGLDACQGLVNELLSDNNINFATGKATIREDSFALLENIKITTLKCPQLNVEISGHTDSTGNLNSNIALSERRAQAVVEHLIGLELNVLKLTAIGHGPSKPIAENTTSAGRAQNRRIEFTLKN